MIVETIDQGWGTEHPLKQMEMEIVNRYLHPYRKDASRTVIINSTWYDDRLHAQLQQRFKRDPPDRIVLISMLDSAICQPHMFANFGCEVRGVGYYPGTDWIDYWSVVVDRHMTLPGINLLDEGQIDRAFMCLNRKPHWHRARLYRQMLQAGIVDEGLVSMGGDSGRAQRLLPQDSGTSNLAPNGGPEQTGIANDIVTLGHATNWQRHFINIVTETQYDVSGTTFVTEKIYKPMLGLRPFLVYAPDGACAWLEDQGFQNFTHDFCDMTDLALSQPDNLVPFLHQLVLQGPCYWQHKLLALREKILHNRLQFDRHIHKQKIKIDQGIKCLT